MVPYCIESDTVTVPVESASTAKNRELLFAVPQ
jgi:hypothetical protein